MNHMELLTDNNILILSKPLARALGIGQAIMLRFIAFWMKHNEEASKQRDDRPHFRDGRWWTYNTYAKWADMIEIYSTETVKRYFLELEELGLLISSEDYNKRGFDKTKWYTIDFDAYMLFMKTWVECGSPIVNGGRVSEERQAFLAQWEEIRTNRPSGQVDPTINSSCPHDEVKLTRPIPVSTSVNTESLIAVADDDEVTPAATQGEEPDFYQAIGVDMLGLGKKQKEQPDREYESDVEIRNHPLAVLFLDQLGRFPKALTKDEVKELTKKVEYMTEDRGKVTRSSLLWHWDNALGFDDFCLQRIPELLAMDRPIKDLHILKHLCNFNKTDGKGGWLRWQKKNPDVCNESDRAAALEELALPVDIDWG